MLVPSIIIILSVFGIWLLYRCHPIDEWDDWPGVHDFVGEEAEDYEFSERLNDYIRKKELGL